MRLFTLDTNRQTHTLSDPNLQRTSGLEAYSMLMTFISKLFLRYG